MKRLTRDRDPDRLAFCAFAGVALLSFYSPLLTLGSSARALTADNALREAKAHAVQLVPAGAPVAASNQLGGYLSGRRYISVFPYVREATWVVVDRNDRTTVLDRAAYLRAIKHMDARPGWTTVYASHGVQVLRRNRVTSREGP
jgi:hypothetical protein